MRILCIGAGAIGICIGGSLAAQGAEVAFLVKAEQKQKLEKRELKISKNDEVTRVNSHTIITNSEKFDPDKTFDCILIAVKAFDTDRLIDQLKKDKIDFQSIVCLQNGVENEDKFHAAFPEKGIIGASVVSAVSKLDEVSVRIEKNRGIGLSGKGKIFNEMFNLLNKAGLKPKKISDLNSMKWSKMTSNLFSNASSAILDMTPLEIYQRKKLFRMERDQIKEALAVVRKMNLKIVNLPGLPIKLLAGLINFLPEFLLQPMLIELVVKGRGDKMPSFYIEKMKESIKSEVNDLNGAVVRFGDLHGVAVPVNRMLTNTLNEVLSNEKVKDSYSHQPERLEQNYGA